MFWRGSAGICQKPGKGWVYLGYRILTAIRILLGSGQKKLFLDHFWDEFI